MRVENWMIGIRKYYIIKIQAKNRKKFSILKRISNFKIKEIFIK